MFVARGVRPIAEISSGRPQQAGRIKLGKKVPIRGGGQRPTSIETFRFVSRDVESVQKLAALYGGTVQMVDGAADLESQAREINVILPPDPLGGTPIYELWSGGGCQRRCDGEEATVPVRTNDDVSFIDTPCICAQRDQMECKPTVRLSVLIPEVNLSGVWNLKTNSWAAAREMQQMVSLIEMAQTRGLVAATLAVEQREQMTLGQKKKFVVPVLRLKATLAELAAGAGNALGMPEPALAALGASEPITQEQRLQLNAAWHVASEDERAAAMQVIEANGMTNATLSASVAAQLIEMLDAAEGEIVE